ncbi:hypothetical protein [Burkholderia multivorans]|uniref:hypothetical protein n=1 Tax=Burkholderia multivorans TaxID=87883 RepID=UPI000B1D7F47|nr:hypothetical protein [Burkholderia multivorans]
MKYAAAVILIALVACTSQPTSWVDHGAASSTGYQGAASSTGDYGAASSTGKHSCALSAGIRGKAKGADGCALFLVYRDESGDGDDYARIVHAKAFIVGQNGIKADTWYSLNESGEPIEV